MNWLHHHSPKNQNADSRSSVGQNESGNPNQKPTPKAPLYYPDMRPLLPRNQAILAVATMVVSLLTFAFGDNNVAALVSFLLAGTYLGFTACHLFSMLMILCPPLLLAVISGGFTLPAYYTAVLAGGITIAKLLTHKREIWCVAGALPSLAVVFLLDGAFPAVWVLTVILVGVTMAYATMAYIPRVTSVTMMACGFAVGLVALVFMAFADRYGTFSLELFDHAVTRLREIITETIYKTVQELISMASQQAETQEQANALASALTEEKIGSYVSSFFSIAFGWFVVLCLSLAFFTQAVFLGTCQNDTSKVYFSPATARFSVSGVAAVLFVVSYLCALLASDTVVGMVGSNLHLILKPALFLVGFNNVLARLTLFGHKKPVIAFLWLIITIVLLPTFAIAFFSFFGAFLTARRAFSKPKTFN